MMRHFYTLLFYLLLPFIFIRLWWRGRKAPAYRQRWAERLGFFDKKPIPYGVWFHAVSVGETLAAIPIIKALQQNHPELPITVTSMTPTGSEQVKQHLGDSVFHVYVPYDVPMAITRFLQKVDPSLLVILETELWPNLIQVTRARKIPVMLVNARLSERSYRGYKRFERMVNPMLKKLNFVTAQFVPDAKRFIELGVNKEHILVTGSVKFDLKMLPSLPQQAKNLRYELGITRKIWIAGSTHQGEDEMVLKAHRKIKAQHPDALLIIVPRHPERFSDVEMLIRASGFSLSMRTENDLSIESDVLLVNKMGELLLFYGVADVAFVGGSFVKTGGHNPLEPALWSVPVVMGSHIFNFQSICELMVEHHAIKLLGEPFELSQNILQLFHDEPLRSQMGDAAHQVLLANQGALARTLTVITKQLGCDTRQHTRA